MADNRPDPRTDKSVQRVEEYSKPAPKVDGIGPDESMRLAKYWKDQLDEVDDEYRKWVKRGRTIEKRYRDERNRVDEEGQRRYNLLWSNVETLLPALYARAPVPVAERRFRDKDPVGRGAAQILERAMRNEIEINDYHESVGLAVKDYLLCGRGTCWIRYEPEIEESVSIPTGGEMDMRDAQGQIEERVDDEEEEKLNETGDRIVRESVPIDYVPWTDFFIFPAKARVWKEVVAVAKRIYMTRAQMEHRFGKEIGKNVPLEKDDRERRRQNESVVPDEEADHKGQVFEIWNRQDRKVYWVAEGYNYLCDRQDDPLKLDRFFPVPRPLLANMTTNTLVPVPDYMEYQDQAIQLDELTNRITLLSKACKVAGVYNAQSKDIRRLLDESVENELIPVDSWAAFGEKGGVAGQISMLPLKEIMGVLQQLMEIRERVFEEADRLTGMSDIMRGTSDARETMGAQRLKTNNTGTRLSYRQSEIARFCRDLVRLMAEVMCDHFTPKSLIDASGALFEEGLGDIDPDDLLDALQPPTPAGPPPPQGAQPGAGAPPVPSPGAPGPTPPSTGPGQPPAPGLPAPIPPQQQSPALMGMQQQQIPPEIMAKLVAIQRIMKSIKLLRDQAQRGFRVDIEVDSTIFQDQQQDKADRMEFLNSMAMFMEKAFQMGQAVPQAAPLLAKFIQFAIRGFKVGRDLESAVEDFGDQMAEIAQQRISQPQGPSPEQQKLEIEKMKAQSQMQTMQMRMKGDQAKAQAEQQRQQLENQGEAHNAQMDMQQAGMDVEQRKVELEIEKLKLQIELEKAKGAQQARQHDAMMGQQKMAHDQARGEQQLSMGQQKMAHEQQMSHQQMAHAERQQAREDQRAAMQGQRPSFGNPL